MNKEMINSLLNKVIELDCGGSESQTGMLMAVEDDHLTLLTEDDGVVYYKVEHIKGITQDAKNEDSLDVEVPENFEFVKGSDFKSVMSDLRYEWVQINNGGSDSVEGVLQGIADNYITLVQSEKILRLSVPHIQNVSYGLTLEKEEEKEEKK